MLVLSRKKYESIMIGDSIEVKVLGIEGETVKIGIVASRDIEVYRKEIYLAIKQENERASLSKGSLAELKQWLEYNREKSDK